MLLEEIRLEIMFDDHLVTNRAFLDYKTGLFGQVAKNLKTTLWSASGGNTPRNNVILSPSYKPSPARLSEKPI